MTRKNIVLVGMPSCGKSTVGVLLAKKLGYKFVDSDLLIQEAEGRLLHEIIAEDGIDGFLKIEERVNLAIGEKGSATESGCVVATGGSAIYSAAAMQHFRACGLVVYLKMSYEETKKRLGNFSHRGVVMPEGYDLRKLYDERCALYEKYAHITVDEQKVSGNIGATLDELCRILQL
ncbi:MAG: shikimate kinase [Clostridia bacterium]|nr:shikimate kinase [Clostridia bacterium]